MMDRLPDKQDKLLLTDEEEKQIEKELAKLYLDALRAHKQSEGFTSKPEMPTFEEVVKAKLEAQLIKVKQLYKALIENTLRDFSDIEREEGHPKSYWAGYHYARDLIMAALEQSELEGRWTGTS